MVSSVGRYVIARESNIVRVDFNRNRSGAGAPEGRSRRPPWAFRALRNRHMYGACLTGIFRQMPRRATSTSFRPGQSGNPNGRPRILADVQTAARVYSAEAIETLARIMRNPNAPAATQIAAACALLDRGFGKPLQTVESTNQNINYVMSDQPMTEEEWAAERVTEH